jgi:hypothetical protein
MEHGKRSLPHVPHIRTLAERSTKRCTSEERELNTDRRIREPTITNNFFKSLK